MDTKQFVDPTDPGYDVATLREHVRHLERRVRQLAKEAQGWQPIETAPAHGMVLLAAEFDGPGDWRIKCGYRDSTEPTGWRIWGGSWQPTHWMPLPLPPGMALRAP